MKILSVLAASAAFFVSACTVTSVYDRDTTVRIANVEVADTLNTYAKDLIVLLENDAVGEDLKAYARRHGPSVVTLLEAFFETGEACVVIDGRLVSDPASGKTCERGTVRDDTKLLASQLFELGMQAGLDTEVGLAAFAASRAMDRLIGRNDGGIIDGFQKGDDLSLQAYKDALGPLRLSRDRIAVLIAAPAG